MGKSKKLALDFDLSISNIKPVNPSFSVATVCIAYTGDNRNRSTISKAAFEKALPTLKNVPLVGYYDEEAKTFGGHEVVLKHIKDGVEFVPLTTPFGVIPDSAPTWWDTQTVHGVEKECLFTQAILWKRQPGYELLAEKGTWGQSMEIALPYGCAKDSRGYLVITDMYFEALCILGEDVEPCYEPASVQLESDEAVYNYKQQFDLMLSELRESMNTENFALFMERRTGKGEEDTMDKETVLSILKEFNVEENEIDFDYSGMDEEGLKSALKDFVCKRRKARCQKMMADAGVAESDIDFDWSEMSEDDFKAALDKFVQKKKRCERFGFAATYDERRRALDLVCDSMCACERNEDGLCIKSTYTWLIDFDDQYAYVHVNHYEEAARADEKVGRYPYKLENEGGIYKAEFTGDFEEMVVRWLTLDENAQLERSRSAFDELQRFHDERIAADRKYAMDSVLAEFEDLAELDEYKALTDGDAPKAYSFESADALREKLYAIRGKSKAPAAQKFSKNPATPLRAPMTPPAKTSDSIGALFEQYAGR